MVRVAVIDSGAHHGHPHLGSLAGGIAFGPNGFQSDDYTDRIGHGTAVASVIREKCPQAEIYAVKVFDRRLVTDVGSLVRALDWCATQKMRLVNLSLGTSNPNHAEALQSAVYRIRSAGGDVIAALEDQGVVYLPGSLDGVIPVKLDWDCPRGRSEKRTRENRSVFYASGYPRPIPGVPPERNLKGVSFAVANVTGLLARDLLLAETPA